MRHLFIDPQAVASATGLERCLHRPVRCPDNPVIIGDRPWDKRMIECNGRPVLFDEELGLFRMWYVAAWHDSTGPSGFRYLTCYATSPDGTQWEKPVLGQRSWEGRRDTNLIRCGVEWMRRPNVIEDGRDPDPGRRFKMTYVDHPLGGRGVAIVTATSPDGLWWRAGDRPWYRRQHNANLLGWDDRSSRYVLFPRLIEDGRQGVGRATSEDFETWSRVEPALIPEPAESHLQFKGMPAFHYEGIYLGMLLVFRGEPRQSEAELTFSRDGVHWERLFPGKPFFELGQPGAWDCENVLPVAPVVSDDVIQIFYSGWNVPYTLEAIQRAQDGWIEDGVVMQRAIGQSRLRPDGFVSLRADSAKGAVVTAPVRHPGTQLSLNAAMRGRLRVAVLDEGRGVLREFSLEDCLPVQGDDLRHCVSWQAGDPSQLAGRRVKLQLVFGEGDLFSFEFNGGD